MIQFEEHIFFQVGGKKPPTSMTKIGIFERSYPLAFLQKKKHPGRLTFQENCNTTLEHTPTNPPDQLWKDSHYSLLVKV